MYAQFDLPKFSDDDSRVRHHIILAVDEWSKQHDISYTTKVVKGKLRICFPRYEDYTFFAMSWNPIPVPYMWPDWFKFELIEPMNL